MNLRLGTSRRHPPGTQASTEVAMCWAASDSGPPRCPQSPAPMRPPGTPAPDIHPTTTPRHRCVPRPESCAFPIRFRGILYRRSSPTIPQTARSQASSQVQSSIGVICDMSFMIKLSLYATETLPTLPSARFSFTTPFYHMYKPPHIKV